MSRIDDLIAEYCPDGVEYKRLGDVCKIKNGKDYKHLSAGDIPVYGSGGVMDVRVDTSVYNRPTVLLPRKGSIANVFYVDGPFWNVDTIFYTVIDEEQVIPRYLYHVMMNAHIENYSTGSAARPSLTPSALNKIEIPVPPLPVQEEIVRILDSFSSLEAELEAELEARRKQYAYYRDQLIRDCPSIRWIPLSEISENCDKSRKPIKKEKRIAGKTPYYGASGVDLRTKATTFFCPKTEQISSLDLCQLHIKSVDGIGLITMRTFCESKMLICVNLLKCI